MSLIVNGTEIENVVVIKRATGESVEIEKLQDQNGNVIFEKISAIIQPNTALVYMAYDNAGNRKYLRATGSSVEGTTYYYETKYADTFNVANIPSGTVLSGNNMASGGPFYTLNPSYNGTPSYYSIGGSGGTVDNSGVNLWDPLALPRGNEYILEFIRTASSQNGFLLLPSEFNGKPIKKISYGAFSSPSFFNSTQLQENTNITKTTGTTTSTYIYTILPDTIEEILNQNVAGLYFVNIPKNLRVIGASNSGWLKGGFFKLEVPRTVTRLYRESFGTSPSELYFLHTATDPITMPTAGQNTGAFYGKTARTMTIYTDNPTIKNYNYSADNVTATIYHLDGSAWE